jgi:hypothetical protein
MALEQRPSAPAQPAQRGKEREMIRKDDPARVLDEISQEAVPQDVNLLPGVLGKIQKGSETRTMNPKTKLAFAALAIVVLLTTLFFTLPGAASAMRKILGFIPGIGMVDQSTPLRVLSEPVVATRDGFTVTVESAVLDSEHTVLTYKVEGPFESASQPQAELNDACFAGAELRLPDGTAYTVPGRFPDTTWENGYRQQNTYPAIPADVKQASLFLPCLHARLAGQGPENWELALNFIPAPADLTLYPVSGQTTATPASTSQPFSTPEAEQTLAGIHLMLENVIPLPDGQLVLTRLDWRDNPKVDAVDISPEDVKIFDANDQEVASEQNFDAIDPNESYEKNRPLGYKTSFAATRLVVNAIQVYYSSSVEFTFDPGPNRLAEQTWVLNKDIDLDGRTLRIISITIAEFHGNASMSFEMESSDGIMYAGLYDSNHPPRSGGGSMGDGISPIQSFSNGFNYDGGLPEGPITLLVTGYAIRMPGEWELAWTPAQAPATSLTPNAPTQAACLNEETWKAAMLNPRPIPAELNRKVLYEKYDINPDLYSMRLDGSEEQTLLENAGMAAISADGSQLVYKGADGLYVYNLASGLSQHLPNTDLNLIGSAPFWSPDGTQIGFTAMSKGSFPNIYLVRLDDSPMHAIENSDDVKLIRGWMKDGRILYTTMDESGALLKLFNPQDETDTVLFSVPSTGTNITLSPDEKSFAADWLSENGNTSTLYVFTLDGSQRKPLLELNHESNAYIQNLLWAPDNNWLLVSVTWDLGTGPLSSALINVDTCEIIPITERDINMIGWLP